MQIVSRVNRNPNVGLIALYHNGAWSSICNDGISQSAVQAICSQTTGIKNGAVTGKALIYNPNLFYLIGSY